MHVRFVWPKKIIHLSTHWYKCLFAPVGWLLLVIFLSLMVFSPFCLITPIASLPSLSIYHYWLIFTVSGIFCNVFTDADVCKYWLFAIFGCFQFLTVFTIIYEPLYIFVSIGDMLLLTRVYCWLFCSAGCMPLLSADHYWLFVPINSAPLFAMYQYMLFWLLTIV